MRILPGANTSRMYDNKYPGTTWPNGPDVILLHSTETPGLPGYSGGGAAPNATFDIKRRRVYQHFSCNRSSRSLVDRPGGAVTNRSRVFQVELVAYSDRNIARSIGRDDLWVGNLTDADLKWVAQQFAPLVKAYNIPFRLTPRFTRNPRYGTRAAQRMSVSEWQNFSGWTYHAAAPENSHWDTGALDIPKIMKFCQQIVGGSSGGSSGGSTTKEWDEMASKDEIRAVVREEVAKFADHGITVTKPDGKRERIPLYKLLSTVYGAVSVPLDVEYGEDGSRRSLRFVLASTQHRVRELTRAVFGTPDIEEGAEPDPVWLGLNTDGGGDESPKA